MIFKAKDFAKRSELEKEIVSQLGESPERKPEHSVSGTIAELARLGLSPTTKIWGVACVATDKEKKTKVVQMEKPNRGKIYKSEIK